jgi:hypothetical protein
MTGGGDDHAGGDTVCGDPERPEILGQIPRVMDNGSFCGSMIVNRHRTGTLHDFGYLLDSAIIIISRRGPDRRRSGPRLRSNKQAESAS